MWDTVSLNGTMWDMENCFYGNFEHSIDQKGRVSIPSTFREIICSEGDTLVITNFICEGARCLEAFPKKEWKVLEANLLKKSRFDPKVKALENFYLSRAIECRVDGSGRINIPQYLRDYASLSKEVTFTAALKGFRVWDTKVWKMIFEQAEAALLENPSLFENVDI